MIHWGFIRLSVSVDMHNVFLAFTSLYVRVGSTKIVQANENYCCLVILISLCFLVAQVLNIIMINGDSIVGY